VVRDGIRNPGQQVMEVTVSSRERSSAAAEERFARLVPELIKLDYDKTTDYSPAAQADQ
jgi:hypothetical protein